MSAQLLLDLRQETEPEILAEISIVLASGNANTAKVMAYQATLTGAEQRSEKMESGSGRRGGADREHESIGANYFVS